MDPFTTNEIAVHKVLKFCKTVGRDKMIKNVAYDKRANAVISKLTFKVFPSILKLF